MRRLAAVLLFLVLLPGVAAAGEEGGWELGLRGGIDAPGVEEHFTAGELYLLREVSWPSAPDIGLSARLDLGGGFLRAAGERGYWLAAGADLVWRPGNGPFEVEAGFRPAWISEHRYDEDDFGGGMQFASHVGIAVQLAGRAVLNYRYLHLSNAGIYHKNDGLDLHLLGVGVRF